MKSIITLVIIVFSFTPMIAHSSDGGTVSPFNFGAGARDLSLGGANRAVTSASTAPFWNASRLAWAEHISLTGFHSRFYDSDVAYQYLGLVFPTLDLGTFGLGIFRLGIDGIEKRDAGNLLLGEIDDNRLAVYVAYGRNISGYDFGMAVTFEHHSLDTFNTTSSPGLNLSLGRRFNFNSTHFKDVTLVINGSNIIKSGMKLSDEKVNYPFEANIGCSIQFLPNPGWQQVGTVSACLTKVSSLDPKVALGLEYTFYDILHLRGGIRESRPSLGVGLTYKTISFDYAMVDRDLGSIHMFSLTTSFGISKSEKARVRAKKQEAEFNTLMTNRLVERNRKMISDLIQQGQEMFNAGNIVEANNYFVRALFLVRSSGADTTQVFKLVQESRERLDDILQKQRYGQYMDSAQVKFESGDYLATRYFANLALLEFSNSKDAAEMQQKANTALKKTSSKEEMIQKRLWISDSLLSYGKVEQALTLLKSLKQFAPDNQGVELAFKKAQFEQWKETASSLYAAEDIQTALEVLDSALILYPGHQWCLGLKNRIQNKLSKITRKSFAKKSDITKPLSTQLKREVEEAYKKAQKLFKDGDLKQAIIFWENVERLAPDFLSVRRHLVNAYKFTGVKLYGQNQLEDAIEVWKKASRLEPENSEISNYIKRAETEIRKLKELSYEYQQ